VATSDPKTVAPAASFEAALAELETIVDTMEGGQLPLADSLAAYKRGAELLQYCQSALQDAQQQVQVLERGVLKNLESDGDDLALGAGDDEA
jgi:exodeoxyribonuclease VII small subunit